MLFTKPTPIFELAYMVNHMKPKQQLRLSWQECSYLQWDWMTYGRGFAGFERALRAQVIGSSYGTVEIRQLVDGGMVGIVKHTEGERTYDRDGEPWPPVGPRRPSWIRTLREPPCPRYEAMLNPDAIFEEEFL
jgi:hypothetical protein